MRCIRVAKKHTKYVLRGRVYCFI